MSTPARVAGFLIALAATFALAVGAGRAFGPAADTASGAGATTHESDTHEPDTRKPGGDGDGTAPTSADAAAVPGGLMISQYGYTLRLIDSRAAAGRAVPVSFVITGPDGRPVTSYEVEHERQLHLIAVRRDLTGFQHVHPELSGDGVWSARLDLRPGTWRLFADFRVRGGEPLTLGADLSVAGEYRPVPSSGPFRTAVVGDYTLSLDGELVAGTDARLSVSVARDGEPVTDLQPYLGAYGHLVALRAGDLAYLHVHPDGSPGDGTTRPGPEVVFHAAVPSAGSHHLFLDFKHEGVVRTATFTVDASGAGPGSAPAPPETEDPDGGHGEHGGH